MVSFFDYDELECKFCRYIGLLPNGNFDVKCPACNSEYFLIGNNDNE